MPLTVSRFGGIQIGFAFLVPACLGGPRKGAVAGVCVCVCVRACVRACVCVCVSPYLLKFVISDIIPILIMLYRYNKLTVNAKLIRRYRESTCC